LELLIETLKWFLTRLNSSRLAPILYVGYASISSALMTTLSNRWHKETNNFNLPVGEMTITVDDVVYLLHIPIEGKLIKHIGKITYGLKEYGIWAGCKSGHGVGWDRLISTTSFLKLPTLRKTPLVYIFLYLM